MDVTPTIPPIVQGRRLVKHYGNVAALQGIHFSILPGECVGFLGPNGAGKTTLLHMMSGLVRKTSGELILFDMDVSRYAREIKSRMGILPQENNLDPDFTVEKNLRAYARYFGISRKFAQSRVEELLHFIQLFDKRKVKIMELSGGMKRRLMLIRSLVNNPELLILDEPTTGLDPQARHIIWQKLRSLKSSGKTMILTTHYMEEAAQLCDRLYMIDRGKILAEWKPKELIDRYVGKEVLEIRSQKKEKDQLLKRLGGLDFEMEEAEDVLYLFPRDSEAILRRLVESDVQELQRRPSTLEDLFFKLTGRGLRE